jgi:peptide/nickel transport system substrate-binding protein
MKFTRSAKFALAAAASAALAFSLLTPAQAATRSTVVIVDSNTFTSLNSSTPDHNLVLNSNVAYMTGIGFNYYDNGPVLVQNKKFGSYKIMSQTATSFKVKYTVNRGVVWSDGTPITGVDLLLSHVISSDQYSKDAGLGDPEDLKKKPVFDSLGYSGTYSALIKGVTLAPDRQSVVLEYSSFFPDWELYAPGVSPVHALLALANGEKKLGTNSHNVALKSKFLRAYLSKDTEVLTKMGKFWSTGYNVTEIDSKTNPLLLVGNGAMQVESVVKNQRITLKLNPRYNSGPATSGIEKIVFVTIADPTAAAQALANKEVDYYDAIATADSVAALKKISGIKVDGNTAATYEHIEVRSGTADGAKKEYTGPFAGMSQRAKDLRTAFLLAYPRQEIIDKIVKPVNPKAVVMNSLQYFPSEPNYAKMIANSGMDQFTEGTQEQRTAKALALVKKYYPDAKAGSASIKLKLLWGQPSNTRRAAQAALLKAGVAQAGFDIDITPKQGWSAFLADSDYDVAFYAWGKGSLTQVGNFNSYKSTASDSGYKNLKVDEVIGDLETGNYSDAQRYTRYLAIEKIMAEDAVSLPIFQWPGVIAYNSDLKGIDPSPLVPGGLWNFWNWKY